MNYVDHCTEQNVPVPEEPVVFNKFPSSITEPNGTVLLPSISDVSCIYPTLPYLIHTLLPYLILIYDTYPTLSI